MRHEKIVEPEKLECDICGKPVTEDDLFLSKETEHRIDDCKHGDAVFFYHRFSTNCSGIRDPDKSKNPTRWGRPSDICKACARKQIQALLDNIK